ncbi:cytochrome P450 [Streptomyces sp. 3MP-14]|uniref:Cytochrome P450 n=1 Tax=Streptomyces mimosae TaxID=2586635 RepID=A0A5N6AK54_9ACTN|nr:MULTISPECIES: cytochrome P450 [Streptomyces]KAB8167958.1 cytochrome P450 [Streptomyces mimosae]KAB8177395.1 cytochrome P450 [Streptomyces sp. 3MP-14]
MEPIDYPLDEAGPPRLNPAYAELREQQPVARAKMPYGEEAWFATRYADVKTVMSDPRFSRALAKEHDEPRVFPVMPDVNIMGMDPPQHTRLRKVAARAFTERQVRRLRPRMQRIAHDLIDAMAAAGPPLDLVSHFGTPFPVAVIAELFGVPAEDQPLFTGWSKALTATTSMTGEQIAASYANLERYVADLMDQRAARPADDLPSDLVAAYRADGGTSRDELARLGMMLLATGHGSTANQISYGAYLLLSTPDQAEKLTKDPDLVNAAVEELLRFGKNDEAAIFARYAREDVELGGVVVRAGEPVLGSRVAANHDPRVFTDPEHLDITRSPNPHIAFGHGPHHCPGAQLARAELQIGLGTLLRRFPELRLAVAPEELVWQGGSQARIFAELPVTWWPPGHPPAPESGAAAPGDRAPRQPSQ